jgi:predicted nucleotidyltransferase/uncharacterized protein (UPF0332 family)
MVSKKTTAKKKSKVAKKTTKKQSPPKKISSPVYSSKTMSLVNERDIAMDFAGKVYKEFETMIKSIVLFGSSAKKETGQGSDIDIIIILDDVSIQFDDELISWYRKHLGMLVEKNRYIKPLHVNSVKLSTWWQDMLRGDPIVVNVLRYGETLIDFGGFFKPLKIMLKQGHIKSTPESIFTLLERSPTHLARARRATLAAVDGFYWSMVDAAHAALIAADIMPPSPEKVGDFLNIYFVKNKLLNRKYVDWYNEIHKVAKEIVHGKRTEISGKYLDQWFIQSDEFLREMAKLIEDVVREKGK